MLLDLRKIGKTVEHEDTPQIKGMINKVRLSIKSRRSIK